MMTRNTKAIHIDQYALLHWTDVSWKDSGSNLVQEASFALSCDGKLGLDQTASWLLVGQQHSQCHPGSNSIVWEKPAVKSMQLCIPSQDAPENPSAEVSLLCQHVAVSHSLASRVALTEPVPLRFIKCSSKTEMNLFYMPSSSQVFCFIAMSSP